MYEQKGILDLIGSNRLSELQLLIDKQPEILNKEYKRGYCSYRPPIFAFMHIVVKEMRRNYF